MAHLTCVGHGRGPSYAEIWQRARLRRRRERARAARRSAQGPGQLSRRRPTASRRQRAHAVHLRAGSRLLPRRRLLPRGAPRVRGARRRDRAHAPQGRRRRRVLDHADVLRQRVLLSLRRARAQGGGHLPDRAGAHADHEIAQIERFTRMCGAVPMRLRLARNGDTGAEAVQLGVAHATLQGADLLANGRPACISTRSTVHQRRGPCVRRCGLPTVGRS